MLPDGLHLVLPESLNNDGNINWANVYSGGLITNRSFGPFPFGTIGTANVYETGRIVNNAFVGTANIHDSGRVTNSGSNAVISTVYVYDNSLLENRFSATIDTANVRNNGTIYNFGNATINTADIRSGTVNNYDAATIGAVFLNGGTVNNIGTIDNLVYTGGTYNGRQARYNVFPGCVRFLESCQ
jgi:hypothetical protein